MGAGKGQRDGYANLRALHAHITDSLVKKPTLHAPGLLGYRAKASVIALFLCGVGYAIVCAVPSTALKKEPRERGTLGVPEDPRA
jgi:hypothetical protein